MKFLALMILVSFSVSCSSLKPACFLKTQAVNIATSAIVSNLQCQNPAAVGASIDAAISKLGVCSTPAQGVQGPIADAVCPVVSQWAAGFLADNAIPAEWACQPVAAKVAAAAAINKACSLIPFSPKKP